MEVKEAKAFAALRELECEEFEKMRLACAGLAEDDGVFAPLRVRPDDLSVAGVHRSPQQDARRSPLPARLDEPIERVGDEVFKQHTRGG